MGSVGVLEAVEDERLRVLELSDFSLRCSGTCEEAYMIQNSQLVSWRYVSGTPFLDIDLPQQ